MREWSQWFETADRGVAEDILPGGIRVSTIFLGLDHNHAGWIHGKPDTRPLIFETMIFGGLHDKYQRRCSTWTEAEFEHKLALTIAQKTARLTS